MKKVEADYLEEYGDIPKRDTERFKYILQQAHFNKKWKSTVTERIHNNLHIEWKRYDLTIWLLPKATPRPRHNMRNNVFYVLGAKDNKDIFKKFMCKQDLPMIYTPCKFTCISYLPLPKTMRDDEKIMAELGLVYPISKPDFDNIAKTYADMIQGLLIYDDAFIIEGVSKKFYSAKPRIEISIEYMTQYDSIFNENKIRKKVSKYE